MKRPQYFTKDGRRDRSSVVPVERMRHVRPRDWDIRRFKAIAYFGGPLNTHHLHAVASDLVTNYDATVTRLTTITHQYPVAYKDHVYRTPFLYRPVDRKFSDYWIENAEIYELGEPAYSVLAEEGIDLSLLPHRSGSFLHNYMTAHIHCSIWYATQFETQNFIPHPDIRAKLPSHKIYLGEEYGNLIPDPWFGIEHETGLVIHPTEIDCGNEQNKDAPDKQTWEGKIKRWIAFFEQDQPRKLFGPNASVVPLFFFNKKPKMLNVIEMIKNTPSDIRSKIGFKYVPDFLIDSFRTPKPDATLLTERFLRSDRPPLSILSYD